MAVFNGPAIKTEIIDEILKSVTKPQDLLGKDGVLKQLTARLVEQVLQAEMAEHLGYEHGERRPARKLRSASTCLAIARGRSSPSSSRSASGGSPASTTAS